MNMAPDAGIIRDALAARVDALCIEILPNGRKEGHEWRAGSVNGEQGKSLGVCLAGEKAGTWCDFANGTDKGDLLDLIGAVRGTDFRESLEWASDWLRLDRPQERRACRRAATAALAPATWTPITPIPADAGKAPPHFRYGKPVALWPYRDPQGGVSMWICRFDRGDGKEFLPLTFCTGPDGQRDWRWQSLPAPRPLYALEQLEQRPDAGVIVCEGEKAADAAANLLPDWVATTWPGGCGGVEHFDPAPLAGRRVVCWPDNDEAGRKAMDRAAQRILAVGAAAVGIVTLPPGLPPKWDLADDFPAGFEASNIQAALGNARLLSVLSVPPQGPSRSLPPLLPATPGLPPDLLPLSLRRWVEDAVDRTQVPVEYVAAPALVGMGALIGRTVGIHPKQQDDWLVIPNLWGMLIGRPGVLKTPAITEGLRPVQRLAAEAHEEFEEEGARREAARQMAKAVVDAAKDSAKVAAKSGDAGTITAAEADLIEANKGLEEAESSERRYVVNDGTVEKLGELLNQNPRGLLLSRDELSGFLHNLDKAGREGDREFYLESWNGTGRYTYDRIGRGTIHIPALCLSILGTIQPGKLQAYIDGAMRGGAGDDGLLQRFQVAVWPEIPGDWRNVDRKPDIDARNRAYDVFRHLDNLDPERVGADLNGSDIPAIRFAPDAQELFDAWRGELERRLRSTEVEGCPAFEAHLSKYRSLMPSIALILHLAEVVDGAAYGPVSLDAARKAAAWCEYLEAHARKIYAGELNADLRAAHLLLSKIKAGAIEDGTAIREIYRPGWSGLTDPDTVRAGLEILQDHGVARIDQPEAIGPGRRGDVIRIERVA